MVSDTRSASPDPTRPRMQTPTRPIPSASGASSVSPDPLGLGRKPRLARPLQGLGTGRRSTGSARLPTHGARTHDVTGTVTPIPQQGRVATVPATLGTAALPLSIVRPYPFHCGVPPHSEKGMGEVNQHHYSLSSPTIDRMISSTTDPTLMTPAGLGNPLQKQPCWQPSLKDKMDRLQQDQDCSSFTRQEKIYSCKSLSPLEAIKGEPGPLTRGRLTHTATLPIHRATTSTLSTTKPRPGT